MDAIIAIGADGRIVRFNSAAERIFYCPAAEAEGQPVSRFIPKQFLGEIRRARGARAIVHGVRADGETFAAEAAVSRIETAGQVLCAIILRDTTEQRLTEPLVWKLLAALVANGVDTAGRDGVIEYVSPAFGDLVGCRPGQMIGRTARSFKSHGHESSFCERMWGTLLSGNVFRGVFLSRSVGGDLIHLDQIITPIRDTNGHISDFIASTPDVTDRVQTEAALRRLNESMERQAKRIAQALHDEAGQLLAAAHLALAEAARSLPAPAREHLRGVDSFLDGIEEQLRRLAHELRPRMLDDLGLVPALKFLAEGFGKRRTIFVTVNAAIDRVPADIETTIYRVVQEALTNVGKHSRATHVGIGLSQASGMLLCTIRDDGVGFDPSAIPPVVGERGFGLSGASDQITALGGTIRVSSAPGEGTELVIGIPLENK